MRYRAYDGDGEQWLIYTNYKTDILDCEAPIERVSGVIRPVEVDDIFIRVW